MNMTRFWAIIVGILFMLVAGASIARAGHGTGENPNGVTAVGCDTPDAIVHVIGLTHNPDPEAATQAMVEYLTEASNQGSCFMGFQVYGWFDEIVGEMPWGDGDPMLIFKFHDSEGTEWYTWAIKSQFPRSLLPSSV